MLSQQGLPSGGFTCGGLYFLFYTWVTLRGILQMACPAGLSPADGLYFLSFAVVYVLGALGGCPSGIEVDGDLEYSRLNHRVTTNLTAP